MSKGRYSDISDEHHVVRRCGKQVMERDSITNEVVGLFPSALRLRQDIDERYLSVNWLEHCSGSKVERLKAIVAIQRAKAKSKLSLESGVAILNAARIREIGGSYERKLALRHTPNQVDPSYSRLSGLPLDNSDELLIGALVDEAYSDFMLLSKVDELP
jgi:hypothetical protein